MGSRSKGEGVRNVLDIRGDGHTAHDNCITAAATAETRHTSLITSPPGSSGQKPTRSISPTHSASAQRCEVVYEAASGVCRFRLNSSSGAGGGWVGGCVGLSHMKRSIPVNKQWASQDPCCEQHGPPHVTDAVACDWHR